MRDCVRHLVADRFQPNDGLDILWQADWMKQRQNGPAGSMVAYVPNGTGEFLINPLFSESVSEEFGLEPPYDEWGPAWVKTLAANGKDVYNSGGAEDTRDWADIWGTSLTIDKILSDNYTLKSITAYRSSEVDVRRDSEHTPFRIVRVDNPEETSQITQEFQLNGTAADGKLEYVVDLFGLIEDGESQLYAPLIEGTWELINLDLVALINTDGVNDPPLVAGPGVKATAEDAALVGYILKIKNKATLDPLRQLLTLRYFYYRVGVEKRNLYFDKGHYLCLMVFESFRKATEKCSFRELMSIWQEIKHILTDKLGLWSAFSDEEIAGVLTYKQKNVLQEIKLKADRLQGLFLQHNMNCPVKAGCIKLNNNYPLKELISRLSAKVKISKEQINFITGKESSLFDIQQPQDLPSYNEVLNSLDEDLEQKNRQLLSLIDEVTQEHAKTKEAFFQIIQ